ncbi:MAG: TetR/AcrR family transcriptional regulator [Clostridia bacterium]|nr:TetR/AcrR family transcriptional regulator [Clostridia bacterium]
MGEHTRQIINTKTAIKESLMELLNAKDFESINISEVCKKAGIHRTTFRTYYDSLEYVLEEIKNDMIKSIFTTSCDKSLKCMCINMLTVFREYHNYCIAFVKGHHNAYA